MFKYAMIIFLAAANIKGCNNKAKKNNMEEMNSEKEIFTNEVSSNIHDIYALISIDNKDLDKNSYPSGVPNLEINLTENKISGFGGCNNYFGEIVNITDSILELGPIVATKRFCLGVDENTFLQKLNKVNLYKREGLELFLYHQDTLILTFIKVD